MTRVITLKKIQKSFEDQRRLDQMVSETAQYQYRCIPFEREKKRTPLPLAWDLYDAITKD